MKNSFFYYYALPLVLLFWSCNSASDSEKKAKEANREMIDSQVMATLPSDSSTLKTIPTRADADFLVEAAAGGMMGVQLGQLAQTNSRNQQVKDFAAMMVKDHGATWERLKTLAASKNITLPDSVSQKEKNRLEKQKGEDFDRAYIGTMVNDHRKDIRQFERAAKNAADVDIKAFAADNLPILKAHLDTAQSIQKKLGVRDIPVGAPPYK